MLAKRQEAIYKILEERGSMKVSELSKLFDVTEKTIRKDLDQLESTNFVRRVHGGVMLVEPGERFNYIMSKKSKNLEEKKRIAMAAYNHIKDGDSIYLDSGTTTYELAKILDKSVLVLTNDPYIATELQSKKNVTLYTTGGRLKRETHSCTYVGSETVRMIQSFSVHKMFLSATAFNFDQGFMIFSAEEIEVKRAAVSIAQKCYALIDYSKFNSTALGSFVTLDRIDTIITDSCITEQDCEKILDCGVKLEVV